MRKLLVVLLLFFCLSCSTVKTVEVPVEVQTIKTEYVNEIRYDSIHVHDSIDRYIKGDSVFIYKYRDVFKYKYLTDTIVKTDSIEVPVQVKVETVKEVNKIKGWQYFLMYSGVGALLMIVVAVGRFVRKLLNK